MSGLNHYYLCGGTFFTILLQATKERIIRQNLTEQKAESIRDMDVMLGLTYVVTGTNLQVSEGSMKKSTSLYKECQINGDSNIPFDNDNYISDFDSLVRNDYSIALSRITTFTERFLDKAKKEFLVKALLELIENDATIDTEEHFFIRSDGSSLSKGEITEETHFEYKPFLLGVLHFVIHNKRDCSNGTETLDSWAPKTNTHVQRNYKNHVFGATINRTISVEDSRKRSIPAETDGNTVPREKTPYDTYLANSQEYYSQIKTLFYSEHPHRFRDFYVCNNLCQRETGKKYPPIPDATIDKLAKNTRFIIITGTGGIGKSMMMRHLFLTSASDFYTREILPIFIPLKNYSTRTDLLTFIFTCIFDFDSEFPRKDLNSLLSEGRCLLLFDGLDEIPSAYREEFEKSADRLTKEFPDNYFVISSRPTSTFMSFPRFSVFDIEGFTKKQAIELIKKLDYSEAAVKEKFMSELSHRLYMSHQQFVSNPLLLTIMLMTFSSYGDIPKRMHVFYAKAYDTMARLHDASKGGYVRPFYTGLDPDIFAEYLSEFCARTYREEALEFTKESFCHVMDSVIRRKKSSTPLKSEDFLLDITDNLCIFYQEGEKYYFIHRSFQEYFAALFFSRQMDSTLPAIGEFFEEKASAFEGDGAFAMLYDMIPEKIKRYILLPYAEQLLEKCDRENGYWTFLSILYPKLHIVTDNYISDDNEPTSYLYYFIAEDNLFNMSADLDLLKWPDEIEDFKRGEWVYLEEPLTEEDLPDFDPAYTVFVTEIPASYLAKHEYPEAEAKLYEIDCSVVEYNKDTYPKLFKFMTREKFPLFFEYQSLRKYAEEQKKHFENKITSENDWFDMF